MSQKFARNVLPATLAAASLTVGWPGSATAATAPMSHAHITRHFDLAGGRMPENIAWEPNGGIDVSDGPTPPGPGTRRGPAPARPTPQGDPVSITVPHQDTAPEHLDPADFRFTRKTWLAATPPEVYGLVSDVTMISIWSPDVSEVRYDDGAGPRVGAWFSGRSRRGDREWTSRSQVLQADPGDAFAFVVDGLVRWRWTFSPLGTGTVAEQSWQLLGLDPVLGGTRAELEALRAHMADGVESTLVALGRWVAENGGKWARRS
ncbi:SRPBCC family protein [Streptomyces sp. SPB162]|uniref:SRPBCC family protein n=1 Tax=Streptomyces sp. SPB162 TaxID=2940560 RepID=UPI002405E594|nr:SRPBCC family protein [Streptomyces sp. SPB162]MDF9810883.1 hypothetical protein [Streptomyces sp. SPB162]